MKKYTIIGIISYVACVAFIAAAAVSQEFGLGNFGKGLLIAGGIIAFLVGVVCIYRGINTWVASDEEATIEENDERNQIIRGKVAQDVCLAQSIVLTLIMIVLAALGQWIAVILLAVEEIGVNVYQMFRFKKYHEEL